MAISLYCDPGVQPDETTLYNDLGKSGKYLRKILTEIAPEYGEARTEWKMYSRKAGWLMKVIAGERNLLFVVPSENFFVAILTFGEKATDAILRSDIDNEVVQQLRSAKKYAEGRTIQLDVRTSRDLAVVTRLVKIKCAN